MDIGNREECEVMQRLGVGMGVGEVGGEGFLINSFLGIGLGIWKSCEGCWMVSRGRGSGVGVYL